MVRECNGEVHEHQIAASPDAFQPVRIEPRAAQRQTRSSDTSVPAIDRRPPHCASVLALASADLAASPPAVTSVATSGTYHGTPSLHRV